MQTPQKQSKRLTQNELALTQAAQKQENYSCQMQEVRYPRLYCLRGLASGAPASVAAPAIETPGELQTCASGHAPPVATYRELLHLCVSCSLLTTKLFVSARNATVSHRPWPQLATQITHPFVSNTSFCLSVS